jgi:hypothetical protein
MAGIEQNKSVGTPTLDPKDLAATSGIPGVGVGVPSIFDIVHSTQVRDQQLGEEYKKKMSDLATATDTAKSAREQYGIDLGPAKAAAQSEVDLATQYAKDKIKKPVFQDLPEVPKDKVSPRPFISEESKNALQQAVNGVSTIVQALVGMSAPTAALNGLSGAMNGWAEGDAARVASEWQKYEAGLKKAQAENEQAIQIYNKAAIYRSDDLGVAKAVTLANLDKAKLSEYGVLMANQGVADAQLKVQAIGDYLKTASQNSNKMFTELMQFSHLDIAQKRLDLQEQMTPLNIEHAKARNEAEKMGLIQPDKLRAMAEQYLAGSRDVKQNLGRGIQGPANLANLNSMIYDVAKEKGMSGKDIAATQQELMGYGAEQRTLGTRTATLTVATDVAKSLIPAVKAASDKLSRTDIPMVNKVLKAINIGVAPDEDANADQVQLAIAMNSLVYTYAKALNPTGQARVSDVEHASQILMDTWSKGAIDAGLKQIMIELERETEGVSAAKSQVHQEFVRGGKPAPTTSQASPSTKTPYPTATNPKTGEKMIYFEGEWQPLK